MGKNSIVNEFINGLYTDIEFDEKDHDKYYNLCMYYQNLTGELEIDKFKAFLKTPIIKFFINDHDYENNIIAEYSKYDYLFESFDIEPSIEDKETYINNKKYVSYEYIKYVDGLFDCTKYNHLVEYKINNTDYSEIIKHLCIKLYLYKNVTEFVEYINSFNEFLNNNEQDLVILIQDKNNDNLCVVLVDRFFEYLNENPDLIKFKKTCYLLPPDFDISKEMVVLK